MATTTTTKVIPSLLEPLACITPNRTLRSLTRKEIAFCITQGQILTISRGLVLRMNGFLNTHPGGDLPVLHFCGRDSTDEVEAYHPVYAMKRMKHFVVAKVADEDWEGDEVIGGSGWKPLVPPVHLGWPGKYTDYEGVPSLEVSLALMKGYEELGYPTVNTSPMGTTLPFLSVDTLEPPPPPDSIDPVRQQALSISFRKFRRNLLQEEGLFELNLWELYKHTLYRCTVLYSISIMAYIYATNNWYYALSALTLGLGWHQTMFVVHDAGHTELTGNRYWDRAIGATLASWCAGLSLGWWIDQHDVHHLITNHPEHDPDIQLMPFFAFSTRFFDNIYSTFHNNVLKFDAPTQFLIQYQHVFFYPVMVFARFSLFGKSYYYLLTKAKPDGFRNFEIAGCVFFWTWFTIFLKSMGTGMDGWITRTMYSLILLLAVCPIHIQIVLSHSAQDSEDVGVYECFVHRQLRTTMDIACPTWLDWVHGGLQHQISHHLFPRLSRPNLRRAQKFVKAWALENSIEFKEKSFTEGNEQMVGMLGEIAGQCRAMLETADLVAKGKVHLD